MGTEVVNAKRSETLANQQMVDLIREVLGMKPLYAIDRPSDYHYEMECPTAGNRSKPGLGGLMGLR